MAFKKILLRERVHFNGTTKNFDDYLAMKGFTIYDIPRIVSLEGSQFDLAISGQAHGQFLDLADKICQS